MKNGYNLKKMKPFAFVQLYADIYVFVYINTTCIKRHIRHVYMQM